MFQFPLFEPSYDPPLYPPSPPSPTGQPYNNHTQNQNPETPPSPHYQHTPTSVLALLLEDEKTISDRKRNIRRFGCSWLRPIGVSKTMQEIDDEIKEREEAARESALQAQMAEAQQQQEMEGEEEEEEEEGEGQQEEGDEEGSVLGRDLDEDIPDADQEGGWVDDEDDDSGLSSENDDDEEAYDDNEDGGGGGGGDILQQQQQQQQGVFSIRSPGAAVGLYGEYVVDDDDDDDDDDNDDGGRDLDENIPDGGSYQHTDTEVEDESSFEGEGERSGFAIGAGLLQQLERR